MQLYGHGVWDRGQFVLYSPFVYGKFITKLDMGYTAVKNIDNLPLSMFFFAGGLSTIRGYANSSIGPGRYLTVGSVEYVHHLYGNWNGAVFYDMGTATNHFGTPLSKSTGIGIVYDSLIGPIKLYGTQALSRPNKPYGVEFSIGPEF